MVDTTSITAAHRYLAEAFLPTPLESGLNRLAAHIDDLGSMRDILAASADLLQVPLTKQQESIFDFIADMAELPHNGSYHNADHFREVVACTAFLIDRCGETLRADEKFLLLIAAASHDLRHDGMTNTREGVHRQFHLEDQSFASVARHLTALGMPEEMAEDMHVLLRATDTSRSPLNPVMPSPADQVRRLDRNIIHNPAVEAFNSSALVDAFRGRASLWHMAVMLQAADIMPSSVLSLGHSIKTSVRLELENRTIRATPANFAGFASYLAEPALSALPRETAIPLLKRLHMMVALVGEEGLVSFPAYQPELARYRPAGPGAQG